MAIHTAYSVSTKSAYPVTTRARAVLPVSARKTASRAGPLVRLVALIPPSFGPHATLRPKLGPRQHGCCSHGALPPSVPVRSRVAGPAGKGASLQPGCVLARRPAPPPPLARP